MQFAPENTSYTAVQNSVVAAMETGNAGKAREIIASSELSQGQIDMLRYLALKDYGIAL